MISYNRKTWGLLIALFSLLSCFKEELYPAEIRWVQLIGSQKEAVSKVSDAKTTQGYLYAKTDTDGIIYAYQYKILMSDPHPFIITLETSKKYDAWKVKENDIEVDYALPVQGLPGGVYAKHYILKRGAFEFTKTDSEMTEGHFDFSLVNEKNNSDSLLISKGTFRIKFRELSLTD